MAENEMTNEKKSVTINFKEQYGISVERFTSKDGRELARIKVPDEAPMNSENHRNRESFIVPANWVHENQKGDGLWIGLPEDGKTTLRRSVLSGQDENGQNVWGEEKRTIKNSELSDLLHPVTEITFSKNLIDDTFTSKDGKAEYARINVPNQDQNDKRPWESFVVRNDHVTENENGKSVTVDFPKNWNITLSRPILKGQDENGKNIWEDEKRTVTSSELKSMMESYKSQDRESVHAKLDKEQRKIDETPEKEDDFLSVPDKDVPFK